MRVVVVTSAFTLAGAGLASAEPVPQAQWPAEVRTVHEENVSECREQRGRLTVTEPEYVVRAELNGDGRPDYLVDTNFVQCSTAASYFCGTLGCGITLLMSRPDGRLEAEDSIISHNAAVIREGGRDFVSFGTSQGEVVWGWNGREFVPMNEAERRRAIVQGATGVERPLGAAAARTPRLGVVGHWTVARSQEGNYFTHSLQRTASIETIGVGCIAGQPHLMTLLPNYRGRTARIGLTTPAGSVEIALQPRGGGWVSTAGDPRIAELLGGAAPAVDLTLNGRPAGRISLSGSSRALQEALGACWSATGQASMTASGAASTEAELRAQAHALFGLGDGDARFSPSLNRILERYEQVNEIADWGTWICACQDIDRPRLSIDAVRIEGDRAEIDAAYSDFGATHRRRILFIRQSGQWLIDDVYDGRESMRTAHMVR